MAMIKIEPVQPTDWVAALEHVLVCVPPQERAERLQHCVHLLEEGTLDPRGVWIARDLAGAIIGVQVCVPIAGKTCLFWMPAAAGETADALVRAGVAWCRSIGCKMAQAFVAPEELAAAEPLVRQGFRRITRMHQLQHDLIDLPATAPNSLSFETLGLPCQHEFVATLKRTYEGTLDCPELNGIRTIDEIIAGHQGEGKYDPARWFLTRADGEPVGVMMLAELDEGLAWELSYLGLVPEQRRRGHGRTMVQHALECARAGLVTRLILAVDGRNTPALALYESAGFVEYECHEVLLNVIVQS